MIPRWHKITGWALLILIVGVAGGGVITLALEPMTDEERLELNNDSVRYVCTERMMREGSEYDEAKRSCGKLEFSY